MDCCSVNVVKRIFGCFIKTVFPIVEKVLARRELSRDLIVLYVETLQTFDNLIGYRQAFPLTVKQENPFINSKSSEEIK